MAGAYSSSAAALSSDEMRCSRETTEYRMRDEDVYGRWRPAILSTWMPIKSPLTYSANGAANNTDVSRASSRISCRNGSDSPYPVRLAPERTANTPSAMLPRLRRCRLAKLHERPLY